MRESRERDAFSEREGKAILGRLRNGGVRKLWSEQERGLLPSGPNAGAAKGDFKDASYIGEVGEK